MKAKPISILMYHSIDHKKNDLWTITPGSFEKQIKYLSTKYEIIRLKDIRNELGSPGTTRKLVITFDDGFMDFYTYAFPILKKYNVASTMFVPTGKIDKTNDWDKKAKKYVVRKIMTDKMIQELAKSGLVDFGSHTVDHKILSSLPDDQVDSQISESKEYLEKLLNTSINMFAYPHGRESDYPKNIHKNLLKAGFDISVTAQWGTKNSLENSFYLKRIFLMDNDNPITIDSKIAGFFNWLALIQKILFFLRKKNSMK